MQDLLGIMARFTVHLMTLMRARVFSLCLHIFTNIFLWCDKRLQWDEDFVCRFVLNGLKDEWEYILKIDGNEPNEKWKIEMKMLKMFELWKITVLRGNIISICVMFWFMVRESLLNYIKSSSHWQRKEDQKFQRLLEYDTLIWQVMSKRSMQSIMMNDFWVHNMNNANDLCFINACHVIHDRINKKNNFIISFIWFFFRSTSSSLIIPPVRLSAHKIHSEKCDEQFKWGRIPILKRNCYIYVNLSLICADC